LIAILVLIPVAGFFGVWQGQIEELEKGKQQEETLKKDYLAKKTQAVNLDLHKQQLREIDTQFGALLKQLPNKSQMDALLVDINQPACRADCSLNCSSRHPASRRGSSIPSCRSR